MNKRFMMLAGAAALMWGFGNVSHAVVLIDGFGDSQPTIFDTDPTVGVGVAGGPIAVTDTDLLGNSRTIFADAQTGAVLGTDGLSVSVAGGSYRHSQDVGVFGLSTADWTFTPVDLSGGIAIIVEVLRADHMGGSISITLTDTSAVSATDSFALPMVPLGSPMTFAIPLSSFAPPVDLTAVTAATLLIDGTLIDSLDVRIDFVATVPEPASLGLIGLGLLGLGAGRRKFRRTV